MCIFDVDGIDHDSFTKVCSAGRESIYRNLLHDDIRSSVHLSRGQIVEEILTGQSPAHALSFTTPTALTPALAKSSSAPAPTITMTGSRALPTITTSHSITVHLANIMRAVEQVFAEQSSMPQHPLPGHDELLARRHTERAPRVSSLGAKLTSSFDLPADSDSDRHLDDECDVRSPKDDTFNEYSTDPPFPQGASPTSDLRSSGQDVRG